MYHLYIHMLGLSCSPRYLLRVACLLHLLHLSEKNTTLFDIFFNDLLDIIVSIIFLPHFPFLSFKTTTNPLPLAQSPRLHTHDLETLRCLATMPQDQQRFKNQGSWPFWSEEWSWSWANFATTVWRKNWYNSEMVVFTEIVIILAVSDGFLKFQKFWHRDTYGMTCNTLEMRMHTQMPHSDTKHAFPLFPPRLYTIRLGWEVTHWVSSLAVSFLSRVAELRFCISLWLLWQRETPRMFSAWRTPHGFLDEVLARNHASDRDLCLDALPQMMVEDGQHRLDYDGQHGLD